MCEIVRIVKRIQSEHLVEQLKENLDVHMLILQDIGLSVDMIQELTTDVIKYSIDKVESLNIKEEDKQLVHSTIFMFIYYSMIKAEIQMIKDIADKVGVDVDFFKEEMNKETNENIQDILRKYNKIN